jgi:hypothetical protein
LDYYEGFVSENIRRGKRHLQNSLVHFKAFCKRDFISPTEITENLCHRFRQYLLDKFNGDTPANYFSEFKKVIRAATRANY